MRRLLLCCLLAPFVVSFASPPRPPLAGPARPAAEDDVAKRLEELEAAFRAAQKVNSKAEMVRLVRKYRFETIVWVSDICLAISFETSEELERDVNDLRLAWQEAYDSNFVDNLYEYYSLLSGGRRTNHQRYTRDFDKLADDYYAAKSGPEYQAVGEAYRKLAEKFDEVGDKYNAARSWHLYAYCNDDYLRPDDPDYEAAYLGYSRSVELKEAWEIEDGNYAVDKLRVEQLRPVEATEGAAGPGGPGGDGGGASAPAQPAGPKKGQPISAPMEFEMVAELDEFQRPIYKLDEIYPTWHSLPFGGTGTKASLEFFENGPTFIREDANRVTVDADGDGQGEIDVLCTGAIQRTEFEIGSGAARRKWGFLSVIGIAGDKYQLVDVNLAPTKESLELYLLPAGSMQGTLADTPIRVFDDNLDGIYGSHPKYPGVHGVTTKAYSPVFDAISVDGDERARPFSRIMKIGDTWYELVAQDAGTTIQATPLPNLKTGELSLKWSGPVKPTYLVVRGWHQDIVDCYYDLAGEKSVEVPVGPYQLFYGELRKGKKLNMMKTLILGPTEEPIEVTVTAGEKAVLELGKPFKFDFDYTFEGSEIAVQGTSVTIVGAAGERYERAWNCRAFPEVVWRKKGTKRKSKPEKMSIVSNGNEIGGGPGAVGWEYLWYPEDLVIDTRKEVDGEVELQMFEKKNRLFGKIESDWK